MEGRDDLPNILVFIQAKVTGIDAVAPCTADQQVAQHGFFGFEIGGELGRRLPWWLLLWSTGHRQNVCGAPRFGLLAARRAALRFTSNPLTPRLGRAN